MFRFALAVMFTGMLLLPAVFAENDPAPNDPEAKKPPTVLEKLLKSLKVVVAREKAQPEHDKELLKDIEKLVASFEKMAKKEAEDEARRKVSLDDLSEEDRAALREQMREELRKEFAEGRDGGEEGGGEEGGGPENWAQREKNRRVEKILEDVKIDEEQRAAVEELLGTFITDSFTAMQNRDPGLVNDLKKDLEKKLRQKVGGTKAKQIINNVNRQLPGRGWGR